MIKTEIDKKEVEIKFRYKVHNGISLRTGFTICKLYLNGKYMGFGWASCSDKDQFNKNTGRKVALSRALRSFDREFRKKVWRAYFNARHGKY